MTRKTKFGWRMFFVGMAIAYTRQGHDILDLIGILGLTMVLIGAILLGFHTNPRLNPRDLHKRIAKLERESID